MKRSNGERNGHKLVVLGLLWVVAALFIVGIPNYAHGMAEKIVFHSDGDIWMMNPDGTQQERLTTNAQAAYPVISPDGTRVAFTSYLPGNGDIYVLDLQTDVMTQLTTNPGSDHTPTWSPNSSEIAFTSRRGGYDAIWKIPASGGTATQVTFPTQPVLQEGDASPDWSPDGTRIVFQSTQGHRDLWAIWEVAADGSGAETKIIERLWRQ